jgi:hypothetical protein
MNHYVTLELTNRKSSVQLHALYSPPTALRMFTTRRDHLMVCLLYVTPECKRVLSDWKTMTEESVEVCPALLHTPCCAVTSGVVRWRAVWPQVVQSTTLVLHSLILFSCSKERVNTLTLYGRAVTIWNICFDSNAAFCMYWFCMFLNVNSDYFLKQR